MKFYNKETIITSNYEIHQMSYITPFPSSKSNNNPLLLKSMISANHDKVEGLSANCEILIKGL